MWIVCAHCAIGYLLYFGLFSYCSIRYTQHGIHAAVGSSRHAVIRADVSCGRMCRVYRS